MTLRGVCTTTCLLPSCHRQISPTSSHCRRRSTSLEYYNGSSTVEERGIVISCRTRGRWVLQSNPTDNNQIAVVVTAPPPPTPSSDEYNDDNQSPSLSCSSSSSDTASNVVRKFYGGINARNLALVEDLIAENCVYEDLVFPQPFVGRKAILEFFEKFIDSISTDLQFAIDDISDEDNTAVGVTWHLEWKGKPFPFSKGCSFYRLEVVNGRRKIIYGRDSVEPAMKPGDMALVAIRGVTWLLQRFPQLAERF